MAFKCSSYIKNGFNSIAEDREGNLFLGQYGGGVSVYSPKTNKTSYLALTVYQRVYINVEPFLYINI